MPIGFDEIKLQEQGEKKVVTLVFKGTIEKADFERFMPQIETIIEKAGTIRLLVVLKAFEGWTAGALWEDTKFAARHFSDIQRIAIVGSDKGADTISLFNKLFSNIEICYFKPEDRDKADHWIWE